MKQGRGQLTERIKERSEELFGYEISTLELRLFPYLNHTMLNNQKVDLTLIEFYLRLVGQKGCLIDLLKLADQK